MNLIQQKFGNSFSENIFRNVFIVWFLLFPFDANFLPISIGFMTLYPSLFLVFFLLGYSFLNKTREIIATADKLVISFFILWVIYGLAFFPFVHDKKIAFYEIRSLILMTATIWMIFRAYYILGKNNFFDIIFRLSVFIFILLTTIAFFEFFTGIHFAGKHTEKLWDFPVGMHTYAPVFLYDNPNTFLCYLFGAALLVFLAGKEKINEWKIFAIIFILFFFSIVSDSRFGKISVYILLAVWIINFSLRQNTSGIKKYISWIALSALALIFCTVTKEIYKGPYWKDSEHYLIPSISSAKIENNKINFYSTDSLVKQFGEKEIISAYREYQMRGTDWSTNIRKNLLLNGIYLTKQSKFLGVGPAQFRYYHQQKLVPYPTTTVTNPHDGFMEILSQYGLPILIPYVFIFLFYWMKAFRSRKQNISYFLNLTSSFLIFIIISDMPSAFLILNIGWILIPILLISSLQFSKEKNA